jgi:hypothetical protein
MAFIFYWVGSVTSTFIIIVLSAVSSSIGTGVIFEKFTKKGQDRNKVVTDNYHNAPIEKNDLMLTYLIKGA